MASTFDKKWIVYKMSADLSRAVDTIKRSVILNLMKDAGCSEDDIKLVKMLLTNTTLKIKVEKTLSGWFATTFGSFKGDSLSSKLFTLYLAGALNHLRAKLNRENPPITDMHFPTEM